MESQDLAHAGDMPSTICFTAVTKRSSINIMPRDHGSGGQDWNRGQNETDLNSQNGTMAVSMTT